MSRYQKGTEARDSEWQWHQLGHMQVCISLQTDNHASTPPLRVPELIPNLGSQPAGNVSHKPGGTLQLLSARPAVTLATLKRLPVSLLGEQRHDGCEQFA